MIGMMVQAAYNLVDTFFVGRGVGVLAIAGLSIAFPLQMIIMAIAQTIGIGGSSIISRSLGAKRFRKANRTLGNMVGTVTVLSIIIAITGLVWLEPLLKLFGATPDILPYAADYMSVIFLGTVVFAFSITANNVVRAEGNARFAMMTMLISAGVNTVLDPIFIFLFSMGVRGAAYATIISQGCTALWLSWYFFAEKSGLRPGIKDLIPDMNILKETFAIGASAFMRQGAASMTAVILNRSLGIYGGDLAIAAYGIIRRIMMFAIMPIFGLVQGLLPIVGYNFGARKFCRVQNAIRLSIIVSTAICMASFGILFFFPSAILGLFTSDMEVLRVGAHASRLIALGLPVVGFQVMASGMYQAIGKALPALLLSMARQLFFLIPLVLVLPLIWSLEGIWLAFPVADAGAFVVAVFLFRGEMEYMRKQCS
jgi:putative MATE family efflux protein